MRRRTFIKGAAFAAAVAASVLTGCGSKSNAPVANEDGVVVYHLHVAPDDMGRVIGKHGKIAKALRVVMKATASRANEKVQVEID